MYVCTSCDATTTNDRARFCSICGMPFLTASPTIAATTCWVVYSFMNGRWGSDFAEANATLEEAEGQLNSPAWLSLFRGDSPHQDVIPIPPMRVGRVRPAREGPPTAYEVLEWREVIWSDANGGKWAVGGPADDVPSGGPFLAGPLETV